MKKLLFLYNTHAGKGLLKSRLAAVQDALAAAGWDVTIHPTRGLGTPRRWPPPGPGSLTASSAPAATAPSTRWWPG